MTDGDRGRDESEAVPQDGSRRKFMVVGAGVVGACVAGITIVPAASILTHPLRVPTTSGSDAFIPVGRLAQFKGDKPVKVDLYSDKVDAWNRVVQVKVGSAWVQQRDGQLGSAIREAVGDLRRARRFDMTMNQPECFQVAQPRRQHARGDAADLPLQGPETHLVMLMEHPHDVGCPWPGKQIGDRIHRTGIGWARQLHGATSSDCCIKWLLNNTYFT